MNILDLNMYKVVHLKYYKYLNKAAQHSHSKGQLILKAIYGQLTSPKKRTDEFVLFAFLLLTANKSKFVGSFIGRIYGLPICFLILSDLYHVPMCDC